MVDELVNPIFTAFNGDGFQYAMFIPALCFCSIATVGIPLNFAVCLITVKYRKSHSTLGSNTGVLIALYSFFECIQQFGHFVFLVNTASGRNFITLPMALALQGPSIVSLNSAAKMLALLSADRLFSILAPIFYWHMKQRRYIYVHLLILLVLNSYFLYVLVKATEKYPNWVVSGSLNDFFGVPDVASQLFFMNFAIMCGAIGGYIIVGILVKFKASETNERLQKLYRSLCIIVVFNLGGYFICNTNTVLYILSVIPYTPVQFWFANHGTALLLNLEAALNAPILYWNNDEFRDACNLELGRFKNGLIPKLTGKKQKIIKMKANKISVLPYSTEK